MENECNRLSLLTFPNKQRSDRLKFEYLMDERMGGVSRQTMQSMYKTHNVYSTRSSPKSIERYVTNMMMPDFQVVAWYVNIVARLERFTRIPLDLAMVEAQALAFRKRRFHLLPEEPLPPRAWTVYLCFCCGRVAAFTGTQLYGNANIFYDPGTGSMVCGKKISRVARMRIAKQQESIDKGPLFDDDRLDPMDEYFTSAVERMRICKQDAAAKECLKRARSERRDLNVVPCSGQPVIPIDLKGKCVFPKKKPFSNRGGFFWKKRMHATIQWCSVPLLPVLRSPAHIRRLWLGKGWIQMSQVQSVRDTSHQAETLRVLLQAASAFLDNQDGRHYCNWRRSVSGTATLWSVPRGQR